MTAIVLPDIDRSTLEDLKKRIPDLSEFELPMPSRKEVRKAAKEASKAAREAGKTAKVVGKTADETIDRLLGRKRAPVWPWIAAGIGLVALAGVIAAWFAWFRRPTWETPQEDWRDRTSDSTTPSTDQAWPPTTGMTEEIERSTVETPSTGASRTSSTSTKSSSSAATTPADDQPLGSAPYEEA